MARTVELTQKLTKILGSAQAAQQELQWMRQHLKSRSIRISSSSSGNRLTADDAATLIDRQLEQMLKHRVDRHKPLQYLLQTQPFCDLDFYARPPVLIPRYRRCSEYRFDDMVEWRRSNGRDTSAIACCASIREPPSIQVQRLA